MATSLTSKIGNRRATRSLARSMPQASARRPPREGRKIASCKACTKICCIRSNLRRQRSQATRGNIARMQTSGADHEKGECMNRKFVVLGFGFIVTLAAQAANAQQRMPPGPSGSVTAYVVMTPNGPATCATWTQWRTPGANPTDREGIQDWAEGYISGLAAGSRHDVLAQFQLPDLAAWVDRYCTANPQTKLPLALNALGREMLAHPGGKL